MFDAAIWSMIGEGALQTIYMTLVSTLIAYIIGVPVGILLVLSAKDGIKPNAVLNRVLDVIVNILRSVPFLVLLVLVMPLTRLLTGTSIGTTAAIVPLTLGAAPFVARLIESSIKEVDAGVIEAAQSMGASPMQIVCKVMLPEAKPSLIVGVAIALTTILGYSTLAGFVGGGGLGDIAVRYGLHRYETAIMLVTVVLLVVIVQIMQYVGDKIAQKTDKRR